MSLTINPPGSPLARWSRNIAVFSVQVVLAGIVLHRLLSLTTPVTLNLFATALVGAALAVLLAVASFVAIWREGRTGAWSAFSGLFLGLALMAWPAVLMPIYHRLPALNDVTTDTAAPPEFAALGARRTAAENPARYAGVEVASLQKEAYPDIRPMVVPRPATEIYDLMSDTIKKLHWTVVDQKPPGGRGDAGTIEAVDRTLVLGFYDDVVVRIDGDARESRIDVRSASRYGLHDFGRNASRIRSLFREFQTRLDATVTGGDRPRRRANRAAAVPKRGKGAPAATTAQSPTRARVPRGSRRER